MRTERTDSSGKSTDSIEERDDSDAKRDDSPETLRNDNGGFIATTLQNIDELRRSLSDADQFGRFEVIKAIGIVITTGVFGLFEKGM